MVKVAITQNEDDIQPAIREALRLLPIEPLIYDRRVGVKPNDTWASRKTRSASRACTSTFPPGRLGASFTKSPPPKRETCFLFQAKH